MGDNVRVNAMLKETGNDIMLIPDSSKPREERELKEVYPDLDERSQLEVFVQLSNDDESMAVNKGTKPYIELKKPVYTLLEPVDNRTSKFGKQLVEYGYQEPNIAKKSKQNTTGYIRPFSLPMGYDKIEDVLEKKKIHVEYDMDEQDYFYLEYRNNLQSNSIKLSAEVFEIMITILENEWDKLELQMNSINSCDDENDNFLTLDGGSNNQKYGNDDGIVDGPSFEQKCAICNDSDCENSNAIVFCDGCDIAVHQECYGIAFIPEGQWLCRKCMINKNRQVGCVFCPSTTGAFKQLDNSLWSHVICALWINELYFANPIYMEPIEGIDLIPKSRWKLSCYICKQKVGACIQCSNKNCFLAYHVTCAKRAGLYMHFTDGIQGAIHNKSTLRSYCDRHCPYGVERNEIIDGINKTRLYFTDVKVLNDRNAKLSRSQKNANKLNIFKWKTDNDTPIPPKLFSDILLQTLLDLKIDTQTHTSTTNQRSMVKELGNIPNLSRIEVLEEMRKISNEICRYWCLKRELKNGSPLVRKNNNLNSSSSILYGNNTPEEIQQKLEFSNILVKNLNEFVELSKMSMQRQELFEELESIGLKVIESVYFPINILIANILTMLNERFDKNGSIRNYRSRNNLISMVEIINKNYNYGYDSISSFVADIELLKNTIINENKPIFNIVKLIKKWFKEFEKFLPDLISSEDMINQEISLGNLKIPFVQYCGTSIDLTYRDNSTILEENDLSEVEDLNEQDNSALLNYLNNI